MGPLLILNRAVAKGAPADVLERLLVLQERWEAAQARKAFDGAFAKAKSEIAIVCKNREVDEAESGGKSYRYEDLPEIARTVNPILSRHGLSYRFRTATGDDKVTVTCIVSHLGGHSEENSLTAGRDESGGKNDLQALGSAITYLQRYALKAALGLAAAADDDAIGTGTPEECVTAEQAGELERLIAESGADRGKLCAWLKVPDLKEVPARQFRCAKDALAARNGGRGA
jgi:hypothetical protein